jgi:hypothetical protein
MKADGGMDDNEIDEYVVRGYILDVDGIMLKKLDGPDQALYLESVLDAKRAEKDRGHPHL